MHLTANWTTYWKSPVDDLSNHVQNVKRTPNEEEVAWSKVMEVKERSPQRMLMLKNVKFYETKFKF